MSHYVLRRVLALLVGAGLSAGSLVFGGTAADAKPSDPISDGSDGYVLVAAWGDYALLKTSRPNGAVSFSWFDGENWAAAKLPLCSSCSAIEFGNATEGGILPLWYKGKIARYDLTRNAAVAGSVISLPSHTTDINASSQVAIFHRSHGEQYWFLNLITHKSGAFSQQSTRMIPGTAETGVVAMLPDRSLARQSYPPSVGGTWTVFAPALVDPLNELRASGSEVLWNTWVVPSDRDPDADYSTFCVRDFTASLSSCTRPVADGTVDRFAFSIDGVLADVAGQQLRWFEHDGTFADPVQVDDDGFDVVRFPLQQGSGRLVGLFASGDTLTLQRVAADGSVTLLAPVRGGAAAVAPGIVEVSGSYKNGKTLKASTTAGGWYPAWLSFSYQWLRDGSPITGAISARYRLRAEDVGAQVQVRITGTRTGFSSGSALSVARTVAPLKLSSTPKPTISGKAKVGATLTAKPGKWRPAGVSLSYQWLRNGIEISGATSSTYLAADADRGSRLTVRVTGSKLGYHTVAKTSKVTSPVK